MVTITTNYGEEKELKDAFEAAGMEVEKAAPEPPAPKEEKPASEAKPGEETPVAEVKTEATPEGKEIKQEPTPEAVETKPATSGFKKKVEKLQDRVDQLREELDLERGDKTRAREELAAVQAKLAEFTKPTETAPVDGPKRPIRPKLSDHAYDQEKFDEALAKYEDELLPKYYDEMATKRVQDTLKTERESQQRAQAEIAEAKAQEEYDARRDSGKKDIEDWDEVCEALGDEKIVLGSGIAAEIIENYIKTGSDAPAHLLAHFARQIVETGESADVNRIAKLPPIRIPKELSKLEDRLVAEAKKPAIAKQETTPAAEAPPPTPKERVLAKPKPPKPLDEPLETVGSRTVGSPTETLRKAAEVGDWKTYNRLRAAGQNRG